MAFDVGFGHYVEAILVAKFIPEVVVRVMRSAYGIQVELLHDLDVLNHAFRGDDITSVGIQFVTVGTLDEDWLSVNQQLGVLHFHLAEAYLYGNHFVATFE